MWVNYTEFVAPSPTWDGGVKICSFGREFVCTRIYGHTGRHQASGLERMVAVWVDE